MASGEYRIANRANARLEPMLTSAKVPSHTRLLPYLVSHYADKIIRAATSENKPSDFYSEVPDQSVQILTWLISRKSRMQNKRQKRLLLETKNTLRIRKWDSRFYWDSSYAVMKVATLLTPSRVYRTPFSKIQQWAQWSHIICTMVKYGETFYRRHTALTSGAV